MQTLINRDMERLDGDEVIAMLCELFHIDPVGVKAVRVFADATNKGESHEAVIQVERSAYGFPRETEVIDRPIFGVDFDR